MVQILAAGDDDARRALLASARAVRERLELDPVGALLKGRVREAAEAYLTAEDSARARRLVLALHPRKR